MWFEIDNKLATGEKENLTESDIIVRLQIIILLRYKARGCRPPLHITPLYCPVFEPVFVCKYGITGWETARLPQLTLQSHILVRTVLRYIWGADDETIAYCVCMFVYMYVYTKMKHKWPVEEVIIFSCNTSWAKSRYTVYSIVLMALLRYWHLVSLTFKLSCLTLWYLVV